MVVCGVVCVVYKTKRSEATSERRRESSHQGAERVAGVIYVLWNCEMQCGLLVWDGRGRG